MQLEELVSREDIYLARIKTEGNSISTSDYHALRQDSMFAEIEGPAQQDQLRYLAKLRRQSRDSSASRNKVPLLLRKKSASEVYHSEINAERASRIYESLCKPKRQMSCSIRKEVVKIAQTHLDIYDQMSKQYEGLKKARRHASLPDLMRVLSTVKTINRLFCKISELLGISLLKKGKVLLFKEGDVVYEQNEHRNSLCIILWGEVKLKEIYKRKVKYCIPGDMLCEEAAIESTHRKSELFSGIRVVKGNIITAETAKCLSKCGILEIARESLGEIRSIFSQNGEKEQVHAFDTMLAWSLAKKNRFRR